MKTKHKTCKYICVLLTTIFATFIATPCAELRAEFTRYELTFNTLNTAIYRTTPTNIVDQASSNVQVQLGDSDFSAGTLLNIASAGPVRASTGFVWSMNETGGSFLGTLNVSQGLGHSPTATGSGRLEVRMTENTEVNSICVGCNGQGAVSQGSSISNRLTIPFAEFAGFSPGRSPRNRANAFGLWSFGGTPLRGETEDDPWLPQIEEPSNPETTQETIEEHTGIQEPVDVAGAFLTSRTTTPVVSGGYGNTNTTYFDPALAVGYGYSLGNSNRFRTYEIPDALPQGDDEFEILYQGASYPLTAGVPFDFTTIDASGVESFLLLGIDETELIDPDGNSHPPFVYGATFMNEGVAELSTFALTIVPEPSGFLLASLLTVGLVVRRR